MATFIDSLTAADIAAGVRAGEFSAVEVTRAALSAIDARELEVQAFLQVTPEVALGAAARVDALRAAGEPLPPLAGVPLAIKDNMNMLGTRTTCASRMLENYESPYTATCVQRMLDAGCVPLGKANMDEFAFGSSTESSAFHRTNNPWDLAFLAAPPEARPRRSPRAWQHFPWGRIPVVRFANLQRFAAWWA